MKAGILAAWIAGEAIVIWRDVHSEHRIPAPGLLAGITGLFAAGAVVADVYPASATLVTAVLFGLDVAGLLDLWPRALGGQVKAAESAQSGGGANPLGGPVPGGGPVAQVI